MKHWNMSFPNKVSDICLLGLRIQPEGTNLLNFKECMYLTLMMKMKKKIMKKWRKRPQILAEEIELMRRISLDLSFEMEKGRYLLFLVQI